ncbi:MAG: 2-phospho-L-lactate transferase [Acidimicrobiales bacterium]
MITALAGGVGAARLLRGMVRVVAAEDVTAVVNVGDDLELHDLHISPDLDTVTYTLGARNDEERGWGLAGESWRVMEALEALGGATWFRLGDRDLATHLYRTQRLAEGASLSEVTAELCLAMGIRARILPVTDDPLRTRLTLVEGEREVSFQEYFVGLRHAVPVRAIRFAGAVEAEPGPGVLAAIDDAEVVVVSPSNPVVSIAPVLAVPGVEDAMRRNRERAVAVSPLVGAAALKGPADRLMAELGEEVSVVGVARRYRAIAATLVIDEVDAKWAEAVEETGMRCVVAPTVMHGIAEAVALADVVLGAARGAAT